MSILTPSGSFYLIRINIYYTMNIMKEMFDMWLYTHSLCLNVFHLLARKPNVGKILYIQTNSFIIFTCLNPVWLVPGFRQVNSHEHTLYMYRVTLTVFNATFNNISVISIGRFYWWRKPHCAVPREIHWQTLSHYVVSSTPRLSGF